MGAYWYCKNCDSGLDKPTIAEVIAEAKSCPHCFYINIPRMKKDEALIELAERVEALEDQLRGRPKALHKGRPR